MAHWHAWKPIQVAEHFNKQGMEMIVQLNGSNQAVSIAQSGASIQVGQRVRVLLGGGKDHILPY